MELTPNPKLDEIYRLVQENNHLLHKMRRDAVYASILRVVWWLILLIGPAILYYYYVQPYLDQLIALYQKANGVSQSITLPSNLPNVWEFFKSFFPGK